MKLEINDEELEILEVILESQQVLVSHNDDPRLTLFKKVKFLIKRINDNERYCDYGVGEKGEVY